MGLRLPLYNYNSRNVVIWSMEYFERNSNFHGVVKTVEVRYSILYDSGELSGIDLKEIMQYQFTELFERQLGEVEVKWGRIVPSSEVKQSR